ncbi:MAG: DUF6502 family protein [Methylophilus sp.]|nr:DUF6502 family protein [Methylophilus sp.]
MPNTRLSEDANNSLQRTLHLTFRRLLKPIVRLLLSNGINYTMILEDIKHVFVSVADEEFKIDDKSQTNSRITLLTGVHRKDVQRIRNEQFSVIQVEQSTGAQIIGLWTGNQLYLDKSNNPLPLHKNSSKGGDLSFEALVASVSKDIRSKTVIDEWLRLGLVEVDDQDRLHLNVNAFIPDASLEEKLSFLRMNLHDHAAAAVNNITQPDQPMLERCVYYHGLTAENVEKLNALAIETGMASIQSINRLASELKASQPTDSKATNRMNFGLYFYKEEDLDGRNSES